MTQKQAGSTAAVSDLDDDDVAAYLRADPEFFQRHRELASELAIPHDAGSAISLIEHQVKVLREDKRTLRYRLHELLRVARDNDRLAGQLHRLTLELLELRGLDAVFASLCDGLRTDFKADAVELRLIGQAPPGSGLTMLPPEGPVAKQLRNTFNDRRPCVGRLSAEHRELAFGELGSEMVSAAVLPLGDGPVQGVLAIGSRDPARYADDQGTVFLARLGELVARILRNAFEEARA